MTSSPSDRRRRGLLLAVCVASFLEPLATTVVTVSLPQIQHATSASFADLQWVLNAYVLTFAALVLTGGALADRFGRRRIFVAGLQAFIVASLVCGCAPTPLVLILGRAFEGVGAAFMLSAGLALMVQDFHGAARVRAFALWGVVVGAGSALGPLVGGIVTDQLGWRWAFFLNVPVCLPLIWLTVRTAAESRDPQAERIDWSGLSSFTAMFFLLMAALIEGNRLGWQHPLIVGALAGAALLLVAFLWGQSRQRRPMVDLRLFADRTFAGASIVAVAIAAAFFTLLVYLPVYLQGVLGYSPTAASLALLPMAVPLLVMAPVSARLAVRMPPRLLLPLGLLVIAAGAFAIGCVDAYGAAAVYVGMVVTGIGAGLINGELSNVAIGVGAPERSGMASGISNTMRQLGFGVGIAGLGAIFGADLARGLGGYGAAFVGRVSSGDVMNALALVTHDREAARELALQTLTGGLASLALSAAALAAVAAGVAAVLIASPDGRSALSQARP